MDEVARAKEIVRETCAAFVNRGGDFERMCESLLREFGFYGVRRQHSGQQFGRDFTADLEDENGGEPTRWYLECKNVVAPIGAGLVAPKLIWHLSTERLTGGFVVVGASKLSNELHELLERTDFPFSIFNWTDDNFVQVLGLCPATLRIWFPRVVSEGLLQRPDPEWRKRLLRPASAGFEMMNPLRVTLAARYDPPFEYAYFQRDARFEKWPTDVGFVHYLALFNASRSSLVVRSIRLQTLSFEALPRRVLVQNKPKGLLEPLRLKYSPAQEGGRDVELLAPTAIGLAHRETNPLYLELVQPSTPGCYVLQLAVTYDGNGRSRTVEAPISRVCVCSTTVDDQVDPANYLRLHVWRKHYDHLARRVFELSENEWVRLNGARDPGSELQLGPTAYDDLQRRPTAWKIQRSSLGAVESNGVQVLLDDGVVLLDLGDVPQETRPLDPYEDSERKRAIYRLTQEELLRALSRGQVQLPPNLKPSRRRGGRHD